MSRGIPPAPDRLTKFIQKIVTHVPTGKEWRRKSEKYTEVLESMYREWLNNASSFDSLVFQTDNHDTIICIPKTILKDCVFMINIFETRE